MISTKSVSLVWWASWVTLSQRHLQGLTKGAGGFQCPATRAKSFPALVRKTASPTAIATRDPRVGVDDGRLSTSVFSVDPWQPSPPSPRSRPTAAHSCCPAAAPLGFVRGIQCNSDDDVRRRGVMSVAPSTGRIETLSQMNPRSDGAKTRGQSEPIRSCIHC